MAYTAPNIKKNYDPYNQGTPTYTPPSMPEDTRTTGVKERQCHERGGTWNAATQTCTMPVDKPKPTRTRVDNYVIENGVKYYDDPKPNVALTNERGETTGVIKDGRTLLGLGKEDVAKLAPPGTMTATQLAEQERIQQITSQIGRGVGTPVGIEQGTDIGEAITAGLMKDPAGTLKDVAYGAVGGAVVGGKVGAVGGPWGAVGGAALGAAVGIWRGIQGNIEEQQKGQVGAIMVDYNQGLRNLRTLAMLATTYPEHAQEFVEDFNTQKYLIMQAHANLKAETDENLEKYIEDGTVNLAKFDAVLAPNGLIGTYEIRLNLALSQGVPMTDMLEALEAAEMEIPE